MDPPSRVRQDLFDIDAEPLKDLETEPIPFVRKPDPDLFAPAAIAPAAVTTSAPAATRTTTQPVMSPQEKLAHYLGAGNLKNYRPLKYAQRRARNRFFLWLGLSLFVLWIIWFVIR